MNFRNRLILFLTSLIVTVVIFTASVIGWQARELMLQEAEKDGGLIAQLLARSAGAAEQIPIKVEGLLSEQMLAQAHILAEFIATAEASLMPKETIRERLESLVDTSVIEEIWVTDSFGEAYLSSTGVYDFVFGPNADQQPQSYAFWDLLTGDVQQVVQQAQKRDMDNRIFKYVGVTGVDQPRIVEVGLSADQLTEIEQALGLEYMVQSLVSGGDINAIWVFSSSLETLAWGSVLSADQAQEPTDTEMQLLQQVYNSGETHSYTDQGQLVVMTPIPHSDGWQQGVTLLRLPLAGLQQAQADLIKLTVKVTLLVILLSMLLAVVLARRVTRPLQQISHAAKAVEQGQFSQVALGEAKQRTDEFGQLAQVFEKMAHTVGQREAWLDEQVQLRTAQLQEKNVMLAQAHQRVQKELDVARAFQLAILPKTFPDFTGRLSLDAAMRPAKEMGGDFYDVFALDDHRVGLVMADVSGKGVPAAFFMAICRTEIQNVALNGGSPQTVLAEVNERLIKQNPLELFVTVFYAVLNIETGQLDYANGGHNPPLLLQNQETKWLNQANGMVLGMMPGLRFDYAQLQLRADDRLVFYTDGITEAFNQQHQPYGEDRLLELVPALRNRSAQEMTNHVLQSVSAFVGSAEQSDDITLLSLVYQVPNRDDFDQNWLFRQSYSAQLSSLSNVTNALELFCQQQGCNPKQSYQLVLALDELFTNSVSYGFNHTDIDGRVELAMTRQDNQLWIRLSDNGVAFDATQALDQAKIAAQKSASVAERDIGGLGLYFVDQAVDDWHYRYDQGQNQLLLRIELDRDLDKEAE